MANYSTPQMDETAPVCWLECLRIWLGTIRCSFNLTGSCPGLAWSPPEGSFERDSVILLDAAAQDKRREIKIILDNSVCFRLDRFVGTCSWTTWLAITTASRAIFKRRFGQDQGKPGQRAAACGLKSPDPGRIAAWRRKEREQEAALGPLPVLIYHQLLSPALAHLWRFTIVSCNLARPNILVETLVEGRS